MVSLVAGTTIEGFVGIGTNYMLITGMGSATVNGLTAAPHFLFRCIMLYAELDDQPHRMPGA